MVMAGPGSPFTGERAGTDGATLLPESKLGRVTMVLLVLPPRTSTPGAAGDPVGEVPAPPGPGVGEIPLRALESEPWPGPVLPAPAASADFSPFFSPARPLPGPVPVPIPEPPPAPPRPGLSPPAGDRASEPLPPVPRPGLGPGLVERTIPELSCPELSRFPAELLGGARTEPTSPGPPRPEPFLPEPEVPEAEPIEGGGGTMLLARSVPLPEAPEVCVPEPWAVLVPDAPIEGGGGMTVDALSEEPERAVEERPPDVPLPLAETDGGGGITLEPDAERPEGEPPKADGAVPTEGGGGITFALSDVPSPPEELRELPAGDEVETLGGGGTTSWVPKSFPMMLLTKDPLAACVGGGGTTLGAEERMPPLSR